MYKQLSTGDLYAMELGDLQILIGLAGQRYFVLSPLMRFYYNKNRSAMFVHHGSKYELLISELAHSLTVSESELATDFVVEKELSAKQNSPIHEVIAHYENECCTFKEEDIAEIAQSVLRSNANQPDCLHRCEVEILANFVVAKHG